MTTNWKYFHSILAKDNSFYSYVEAMVLVQVVIAGSAHELVSSFSHWSECDH